MKSLSDIQTKFKNAVLKGNDASFLDEIEEGGKISPAQRLYIYSHAYKARFSEVLQEDYPVIHTMVGDEVFANICNDYIDMFPSKKPSLRYFGIHMEQYLKNHEVYSKNPVLAELAKFEWLFNDVFDAKDDASITFEDVAVIPQEAWTTLRMKFHPSFKMNMYKWNVPAIWSSVKEDENNPVMPEQYPELSCCIQWRSELVCYFRSLDKDETKALKIAADQKTFPEICEILYEDHGDQAPLRAAELFKNWISEGLICDLDYLRS